MIDAAKARKAIDDYFKNVTLEQLNKDLKAAGVEFHANRKEKAKSHPLQRRVIKRVCSEATEDCKPCLCRKPHEKQYIPEDDCNCTMWNYCDYKGRKVRCTKVV